MAAGLATGFSGVDARVPLFPALAGRRADLPQRGAESSRPTGGQLGRGAIAGVRGQPKREAGPCIFEHLGTEGGKHVNGRKQQVITDTHRPRRAAPIPGTALPGHRLVKGSAVIELIGSDIGYSAFSAVIRTFSRTSNSFSIGLLSTVNVPVRPKASAFSE